MTRGRGRAALLAAALGAALLALLLTALCTGTSARFAIAPAAALRAAAAAFGLAAPLPVTDQIVVELRLWSALTAAGVGACLAVTGAMLQGLFRNGLAEPSLIGVSGGANLGATVAILMVSGYGSGLLAVDAGAGAAALVTAAAFAGALLVTFAVLLLATRDGTVSVTHLLLLGIAVNMLILGALTAVQSLLLTDVDVTRALRAWTFGTLSDRAPYHAAMVGTGAAACVAAIPLVATELDLLAGGEDDARALGVDTGRLKLVVLVVGAFATACAFAAAGQIAFVGLVVPHAVRLILGPRHRGLLLACLLGGPVLVLACDLAQLRLLGERRLGAGVLMAVIGGPWFLVLLARSRRLLAW